MSANVLAWVRDVLDAAGCLRQAHIEGKSESAWFGASIDSRENCTRRVFFAFKGDRTDGHRFVGDAVAHGAAAVVVETDDAVAKTQEAQAAVFHVKSSLQALQELARAYRQTLDVRVIAVTGSSGKTTTKQMIRAVLKTQYRVHSSPGNYNNHIGVPLTVLDTDSDMEYLVCEIGANHVGEIDFLSKLIQPDIGVVTNIGDAHVGVFGSRDRIAAAKAELFAGIDHDGFAILPHDDDYIDLLRERCHSRVLTFGTGEGASFRLSDVSPVGDDISFHINGEPYTVHVYGAYNAYNATAAFGVGEVCGIGPARVRKAFDAFRPVAGRSEVQHLGDVTLIDDSYNANPASMRAAITSLEDYEGKRRIALLGDMGELGAYASEAHEKLGEFLGQTVIDSVMWVGSHAADVERGLSIGGGKLAFRRIKDVETLNRTVMKDVKPGDVILVKASRAVMLDRAVGFIRDTLAGKEG